MRVNRVKDAPAYQAPGHFGMTMLRLQGKEVGETESVWIGLSTIEPGGGTTSSASPVEKFYVVVSGELTVETASTEGVNTTVLSPLDSCRVAPNESRRLFNHTNLPCKVVLVMPNV
jgi:quercetin dioxygenase-like cupin family protein